MHRCWRWRNRSLSKTSTISFPHLRYETSLKVLTFFLSAAKASSSAASGTDKLPVGAGVFDMSEKCVMGYELRDLSVDSVCIKN